MLDKSLLTLINGDCREELKNFKDNSVDLFITSPPYAEQRKKDYNSIPSDKYIEWFIPIAQEIKRIMKPTGSFFLNINPHCDKGERQLYVYELVIAIRNEIGLKYIDEYVWYKSATPRKKTFRLKNSWEPIFHFAKDKNYINHNAILIKSESTFASKKGYRTFNNLTGNVGGYHDICKQIPGYTDPDNVLYFPTALLVKDKFEHPAKWPRELVQFFIKGFCPEDGIICDPFNGSGMTAAAALRLERKCIAIEINKEYCQMTEDRIRGCTLEQYENSNKDDLFA